MFSHCNLILKYSKFLLNLEKLIKYGFISFWNKKNINKSDKIKANDNFNSIIYKMAQWGG